MATYVSYRDGGKTDEVGLSRMTSKLWTGNVLEGLQAEQSDPLGMNVIVTPGDIKINHGSGCYYAWSDSNATVTIATADTSNPRIDRIVAYVDVAQTPTTAQTNNPGLLKFAAVAGTPAATPSAPSDTTVQNAIGVGNPYTDLAAVTVAASVTQISNNEITDQRTLLSIIPKITPDNLELPITGSSWKTYDFGTIKLFSREYSFSTGGNLAAGGNRAIGTLYYPPDENSSTVHRLWSSRMAGNSPFFNTALENNTLYIRNVAHGTIDPGDVVVNVLCIKHEMAN